VLNLRVPPARALIALGAAALLLLLASWWSSRDSRAEPSELAPIVSDRAAASVSEPGFDVPHRDPLELAQRASGEPRASATQDPAAAPEPGTARIVGRLFASNGSPLSGAAVLAAAPEGDLFAPSYTAMSDLEGWYELSEVAPGGYDLGVRASGVGQGSTVLQRIDVRPDSVTVADLSLEGGRVLHGSFEFSDSWADMDMSLVRVVLWRKGEWGSAVARAHCFTSHTEPWHSGSFRFEGLEPGVYVLEAWPFIEEHSVWRGEVDLSEGDAGLPCHALGEDRVWRERVAVDPPRSAPSRRRRG